MNGTTAIVIGAIVVAGAATAAVFWMKSRSAAPAPVGTPALPPAAAPVAAAPVAAARAPAPDIVKTVQNVASGIGNAITGITNIFKGFKLF